MVSLYERALSMHPVCVPARAALLTGCNAVSTGILDNTHWLRPDHDRCGMPGWPALLSAAGYHTEAIGKMHFTPWDISEGFDHRVISEDKRHTLIEDDYAAYLAGHGLKKLRGWEEEGYVDNRMASFGAMPAEHQVDDWVGRQAVEFLSTYAGDEPFACMVAFPGPHDPYNPPREWAEHVRSGRHARCRCPARRTRERFRHDHIRAHAGGSARVDLETFPAEVKRRIRAHYCAPHRADRRAGGGDPCRARRPRRRPRHDRHLRRRSRRLRRRLRLPRQEPVLRAGHARAADRARCPAARRASVPGDLVTVTDIFATLLAAAGAPAATAKDSFPLPVPGGDGPRRSHALGAIADGLCLDDGRHRLSRYDNGLATLYDLADDPGEQRNLIDDPAAQDVRGRLDALLAAEVLKASRAAHEDKRYPYLTMTPDHPAHRRGWQRPYPWPANAEQVS